ncbi:MAG: trehalose-phosphatase [Cyclobacteriaceae bacterium]|nr:trehalose-phosphatase [Cyclobacteriaceae bacterium]
MITDKIKAAIFDLDGVITQTAFLHAEAWKEMFDQYNDQRKKKNLEPFDAFSIQKDYPIYIDGIPRYDGVANFLKSRKIELPWGNPEDDPGMQTICSLGNLKNEIFLRKVDNHGAKVIESNIRVAEKWKKSGLKTAIVSSSKNCEMILKSAGLEDLFEVRIDGMDSGERKLNGKPAPDIFLEAAAELGFLPDESLIVEDSLAGVEAGVRGRFKYVIGIGHGDKAEKMKELGADKVVHNLEDLDTHFKTDLTDHRNLQDALEQFEILASEWEGKKIYLFLDYDGTLSPIVREFDKAFLADDMREAIIKISKLCFTAIVSGRGMDDVKERVKIEHLYYAGSHGFEISGPGDFYYEIEKARKLIPSLDKIEEELRTNLAQVEGVKFERKKFALAVHYREAAEEKVKKVKMIIDQALKNYRDIVKGRGKKVIEIKPKVYWHKGKAINHLLNVFRKENEDSYVIYIGDDITDEDAFMQIREGTGILVGSHGEPTFAGYHLENVKAVREFLIRMTENLK